MKTHIIIFISIVSVLWLHHWFKSRSFSQKVDEVIETAKVQKSKEEFRKIRLLVEQECADHSNPTNCISNKTEFVEHQIKKAKEFALELIDVNNSTNFKLGESTERTKIKNQINALNILDFPKAEYSKTYKMSDTLCFNERDAKKSKEYNKLSFFTEAEYENFNKKYGNEPKLRFDGSIHVGNETGNITLYSQDGCSLHAYFPDITLGQLSTLKYCSKITCNGTFWVSLKFDWNELMPLYLPRLIVSAIMLEKLSWDKFLADLTKSKRLEAIELHNYYQELKATIS